MAKKATRKKKASNDAAPEETTQPVAEILDFSTGKRVQVSVHHGVCYPSSDDGRLVHVESGRSAHTMSIREAADKFAVRKKDGVKFYSEKGFGAPDPENMELFNIGVLVDNQ